MLMSGDEDPKTCPKCLQDEEGSFVRKVEVPETKEMFSGHDIKAGVNVVKTIEEVREDIKKDRDNRLSFEDLMKNK